MGKLKYRHEEKYVVNKNDYLALKNRLTRIMKYDDNANSGQYKVRSLYCSENI
ncbi:VTC domain-containing protein [Halocella sp. SP3-1]|uniref:VTC domain-containing protein n=1 Tax=Halocella sp. SP3-1 TaxID=2382161 RepID=UPI0013DF443A|nr:VTC domain-containing protein [Halocella sp. SP3-1]